MASGGGRRGAAAGCGGRRRKGRVFEDGAGYHIAADLFASPAFDSGFLLTLRGMGGSWFLGFLVPWFLGFQVSWFQRFTKFSFHVFWKILIPYPRFSRSY